MSIALAAVAGCEVLKEESGMAGKLNSNSLVMCAMLYIVKHYNLVMTHTPTVL